MKRKIYNIIEEALDSLSNLIVDGDVKTGYHILEVKWSMRELENVRLNLTNTSPQDIIKMFNEDL